MSCGECDKLREERDTLETRVKELENTGVGKQIQDLVASALISAIKQDPSANMLGVARQFLKDNGYVDLRASEGSPTNHLANNYPFSPEEEGDQFSAQEGLS